MSDNFSFTLKREKDSEVVVDVKVASAFYQQTYQQILNKLASKVKLPGFRPGKAPQQQLEAKVGQDATSETLRHLLPEIAAEIIDQESLNPVTPLDYHVENLDAEGNLEYHFHFTNYPDVKLGDLKKLKLAKPEVEITDAEVGDVVTRLFKDQQADPAEPGEEPDAETKTKTEKLEVTDQMVKTLGLAGVETVVALKMQIRQRLEATKQASSKQKQESEVLEQVLKLSTVPIPTKLLEEQVNALMQEYDARLQNLGVERATFLAAQGLDEAKLMEQKQEQAKQRIQIDLVLNQVAKQYELIPTAAEIDTEIKGIQDDQVRASYESYAGRRQVMLTILQRRALDKLLELASS